MDIRLSVHFGIFFGKLGSFQALQTGSTSLNGRRPESEQRLNVSRPSHGRKLGLLRLWLHGVSRRAHSALCKNFIYSKYRETFNRCSLSGLLPLRVEAPDLLVVMKFSLMFMAFMAFSSSVMSMVRFFCEFRLLSQVESIIITVFTFVPFKK